MEKDINENASDFEYEGHCWIHIHLYKINGEGEEKIALTLEILRFFALWILDFHHLLMAYEALRRVEKL